MTRPEMKMETLEERLVETEKGFLIFSNPTKEYTNFQILHFWYLILNPPLRPPNSTLLEQLHLVLALCKRAENQKLT